MEKLKNNVVLTLNESLRDEVEAEGEKFVRILTIEIYYKEDRRDNGIDWEVYHLKFLEIDDAFDFSLNKIIMDSVRDIEDHMDEPYIETFIYEQLIECIGREHDEKEARDFFEEISD